MIKRILILLSVGLLSGCGGHDLGDSQALPQQLPSQGTGPTFVAASPSGPLNRTFRTEAKILWRDPSNGAMTAVGFSTGSETPIATSSNLDWDLKGTGDFDGDGSPDLLWQNRQTRALGLWYMNGLSISRAAPLPTPSEGWSLVGVGRLNNDSLVVGWFHSVSRRLAYWSISQGAVSGASQVGLLPSGFRPVLVSDVDGGAAGRVVVQDANNRLGFFDANLSLVRPLPLPAGPAPAFASDLNLDTWSEMVYAGQPGQCLALSLDHVSLDPYRVIPRSFRQQKCVGAFKSIFDGDFNTPTELQFDVSEVHLKVGESRRLAAWAIAGFGYAAKLSSLNPSVTNPGVATVESDGRVLATGVGTCEVVASSGELATRCKVTVLPNSPLQVPPDSGLQPVDLNNLMLSGGNPEPDPAFSADGRYVAFSSDSTRLSDWPSQHPAQVYMRDRVSGVVRWLSRDSSGNPANAACTWPTLSDDARSFSFFSKATNLTATSHASGDLYLLTGFGLSRVDFPTSGAVFVPKSDSSFGMSDDGSIFVASSDTPALNSDTNGRTDIYRTRYPERISLQNNGAEFSEDARLIGMSGDATRVAFDLPAVGRVFVRHVNLEQTEEVGLAGIACVGSAFSRDGRFVLVSKSDGSGHFVKNLANGGLFPIDLTNGHGSPDASTMRASFSSDGRFVVFSSDLPNIVNLPYDGRTRCYIHDRHSGLTRTFGAEASSAGLTTSWFSGAISGDGRYLSVTAISDVVNGVIRFSDTYLLLNPFDP